MSMIERFIDYIQFSANLNERACIEKQYTPVPPLAWYKRGYRSEWGFRLYFGNVKAPNLAFVVASGEVLRNLRDSGQSDAEILRWGLQVGAKFTRIDLAVTEYIESDPIILVEDVERWVKDDLVESTLIASGSKIVSTVSSTGKNVLETLYVGSMKNRGKKGIFRAYDKGIELDIGKYLITRLELEDRGEKAHNTAKRIAQSGDISGNFRARFNVNDKDFERLMDADAVSTARGIGRKNKEEEEENDKRWIWLMKQVAPAMREAINNDLKQGKGTHRLKQFALKSGMIENGLWKVYKNLESEE
jgi:hypothetical protein